MIVLWSQMVTRINKVLPSLRRGLPSLGRVFPDGARSKESTCQCRRLKGCGFNPWVRKIPWSRKWHLTPVFLPGKFQRSLATVHGITKNQTWLSTHTHTHTHTFGENFPSSWGIESKKRVLGKHADTQGTWPHINRLIFSLCFHAAMCHPCCGEKLESSEYWQ